MTRGMEGARCAYCSATPSTMRRARTYAVPAAKNSRASARLTAEPFFICACTCRRALIPFLASKSANILACRKRGLLQGM